MSKRSASILSRIVWLHVLALAGVAIAVSAAAYLMLNATANDFTKSVCCRIMPPPSRAIFGRRSPGWSLHLPPDLEAIYSKGYGGYALAVFDEAGHTIFSSYARAMLPNPAGKGPARQPSLFRLRRGSSFPFITASTFPSPKTAAGPADPGCAESGKSRRHRRRRGGFVSAPDRVDRFAELRLLLLVIDVLIMRRRSWRSRSSAPRGLLLPSGPV